MKLPIESTLVVSTGHISRVDNDYLKGMTEQDFDLCRVVNFEHGFILFLSDELSPDIVASECNKLGFSNGFIALINLAVSNNCSYLIIDRDGEELATLKTFNWEAPPCK